MSEDPITLSQMDAISYGKRPLIVCDVDEVILRFVEPFFVLLNEHDLEMDVQLFKLNGNVRHRADGRLAEDTLVNGIVQKLFEEQDKRQDLVTGAFEGVARLSQIADLVFLTAMNHKHFDKRLALLRHLGFTQPLLTTERDKGPALAHMDRHDYPTFFIDDMPHNHHSALRDAADVHRISFMSYTAFRATAPAPPEGTFITNDWPEMVMHIERIIRETRDR